MYGDGDLIIGDKTPQYGLDMSLLKEMWPKARFIHLVRDGMYASRSMTKHPGFIKLINSTISTNELSKMTDGKSLFHASDDPEHKVKHLHLWADNIESILQEAKKIPTGDYLEIRYEDLIRYPRNTIGRIYNFLELEMNKEIIDRSAVMIKPFYFFRSYRGEKSEKLRNSYQENETLSRLMNRFGIPHSK
ncbi:MAG: sulfotransferase [Balneolaceae bacterium]|nr:sulfotransferase [Balneolaceae bacterium]